MEPADDNALLRQFVEKRSDEAFTGLVDRHVNLVYSVALRQVGHPAEAQEITQAVFIILAKKAGELRHDKAIASWLFQTTRLTANNFIRGEMRRHRREQEAFMQSVANEPGDAVWQQIAPMLDEAVTTLGEKDRRAIILRFYEGRNLREVGTGLGASEDAAEKRVARALEKLRNFFRKRGVNSTTATIAGAISGNSVQAAPVGLAKTISTVALAKGAAASASTLTLAKGALKVMAWSKTKTTIVGVAIALLGIGATGIIGYGIANMLLPAPDIQGTWECTLTIPGGLGVHKGELPKTRIVMRITKVNGAYQANFDNIDEAHQDIVFDKFSYKYPYVHAETTSNNDDVTCVGKVDRSGEKISWKALEFHQTYMMAFIRTNNPTPFPEPLTDAEFAPRAGSALQGFWVGKIGGGKRADHIQIKIAEASNGTFRADFYSLGQGTSLQPAMPRQPTDVNYDGTIVKLMPTTGFGMFEGRLQNGTEMVGDWIQGGYHTRTTLTQADYSEYKAQGAK